jgi:serine/threonine protein kinase
MSNLQINKKYEIHTLLGKGAFGSVYRGVNIKNSTPVAIKMENNSSPVKLLKNETKILNYLYGRGCKTTPVVYWYGVFADKICLVMSLCECSLSHYIKHKPLSVEKIEKVIASVLSTLEDIHEKYVIHRDVKPENIMLREGTLFLVDLGLSTFYVDENGEHVAMQSSRKEITGTPKYISHYVHSGFLPSRRDDLISLGYVYLWLSRQCELPWDRLSVAKKEHITELSVDHPMNRERADMKVLERILGLSGLTKNFVNYIQYVYSLDFNSTPLYSSVKDIFDKTI